MSGLRHEAYVLGLAMQSKPFGDVGYVGVRLNAASLERFRI